MPDAVKAFLKEVPTAWDETRVLSGEPGKTVVMARRAGSVWYVGAINGTNDPQTITLPTDFIGGLSWKGTFIQDGDTPRSFSFASGAGRTDARPLVRGVLPRGGLVARFQRQ
jgi:hypothetical protein